jgi:hypothetical protein
MAMKEKKVLCDWLINEFLAPVVVHFTVDLKDP